MLVVENIGGSAKITLVHNAGSSTAANRFMLLGAVDNDIFAGESRILVYDAANSRWRVLPGFL